MAFRNTLKRFKVNRLEDESYENFIERADLLAETERNEIEQKTCTVCTIYESYIWSNTSLEEDGDKLMTNIVFEINEVPKEIVTDNTTLLVYHNDIKQLGIHDEVKDIELEDAEFHLDNYIEELKGYLEHIKKLRETDA